MARSSHCTTCRCTVEPGEVVALLGANGAGKTTTLRSVSGTVQKRGKVLYDGQGRHAVLG